MAKVEFFVDGVKVEAEEGTSVLKACLAAGIYIPHLCSHPDLESRGGCKLCVVNIEGVEGAVTSCTTTVQNGMKVTTKGARLEQIRRVAMEFMLAGHPHDCTSCKMYLKCELQAMMQVTNSVHGRMREVTKTTTRINTNNPLIVREMERCIACGRCIRACKDVRGVGILQLNKTDTNYEVYVGTQDDLPLNQADCQFCSACVEVCPTGALQDMEGVFRADIPKQQALIPCSVQCPAHTDIPTYIRLVKEGKNAEAVAVIREKLSFPHSLGLVCVRSCEQQCKRSHLNDPLSIRNLKRYACEHDDQQLWKKNAKHLPDTGKKVAIVGGGPAGMTTALYLAKQGHDVTVFEKNEKAGGYLQYGIPMYRLPRDVVQGEIQDILDQGVKLECNKNITNVTELKKDYDAVVLAMGTTAGKDAVIPGRECGHNTTAVKFLHTIASGESDPNVHEGAKVIVLGGGNVAFDAARTSAKLGAQVNLFCLEARAQMLADDEEIEQAMEEGVVVNDGTTNLEILGTEEKLEGLRYADITGFRFGPNGLEADIVEGSEKVCEGDYIIFAMGQKADIPEGFGVETNRFGFPVNDEGKHSTPQEGIFAVGDCITGTKSVVLAVAGGRECASEVDIYLGGDGDIDEVLYEREPHNPEIGKREGFATIPREELTVEDISVRGRSITNPVDKGFTEEQASCESGRCLQCDLRCDLERVKMWTEY